MTEPFDMSLVQRGARNRRTPYYEATQRYGPDGFRFSQLLTPRDLSKCAVGQGKYVLICDGDGGIINDPVLTRMDEDTFWFALASSDALLFARGLKNAYPDLDVTIREADVAPLQVQGPKSKDLMAKLLGPEILDLKYYFWTEAKIAGAPVVVTRTGWTSEIGYEVYLTDTTKGTEVFEAIMEAGREFGVVPTGPSDIRRIRGEGVSQRINGVEFDGAPFPALNNEKWPALDGGVQIGKVTSAIHSPRLSKNIGYCWLPTDRSSAGTTVSV